MVTDARVLQQEFIPREVQHRDSEVNYLSSILEPVTKGNPTEPTLLYGPSGAGKTCIAQFIVEELRGAVVDLNTQYVNCWEDYTRFKTLYQLLDGVGQTYDIHRQSTPRDLLLDRLREYNDAPYVVILDEVDQLQDKDLLYDLCRMRDLTLILIANREEELFSPLDDRVTVRNNSFGPYLWATMLDQITLRSYGLWLSNSDLTINLVYPPTAQQLVDRMSCFIFREIITRCLDDEHCFFTRE